MGKNWYDFNFFANDPGKSGASQNSNGSITISGCGGDNAYNAQLATAESGGSGGWTGVAFGGGGYFEATLSFTGTPSASGGRPSFWGNTLEALLGGAGDNTEVDVMEFDDQWAGNLVYGSTLHDWVNGTDIATTNDPPIYLPAGTDLSQPHSYGMLWIPASATSQGSISWYFDGQKVGTTDYWNRYNAPIGPSSNPYAILDQQHLVPTLGTGPNNPMTVYEVSVWQSSTAGDMFSGGSQPITTPVPSSAPPPTPTPVRRRHRPLFRCRRPRRRPCQYRRLRRCQRHHQQRRGRGRTS